MSVRRSLYASELHVFVPATGREVSPSTPESNSVRARHDLAARDGFEAALYDVMRAFGVEAALDDVTIGPIEIGVMKAEQRASLKVAAGGEETIGTLGHTAFSVSTGERVCWDGSCFSTTALRFSNAGTNLDYRLGVNLGPVGEVQTVVGLTLSRSRAVSGLRFQSKFSSESRITNRMTTLSGGLALAFVLFYLQRSGPLGGPVYAR